MSHLGLPLILGIFALAAAVVWFAGIRLADATDALDSHFGLGQAVGGMVLLALVTNLPEIAITVSAAMRGAVEIAVGNILGGIAIQTAVLAVIDGWALGTKAPLTQRAGSTTLVIEGVLVITVLALAIVGHQLPDSLIWMRMTPATALIVLAWIGGLIVVKHARKPKNIKAQSKASAKQKSIAKPLLIFASGALATLAAGVTLELSGEAIAQSIGMTGAVFAATVLAAATSLPELSTGLQSVRNGDETLAVSDIFGGNAFLPVLFMLATLIAGSAVLPLATSTDLYLTGLGIAMTAIYVGGLSLKSKRQWWRLGIDSWLVLAVYALGIIGLQFVSNKATG